ncbi:hypothetical protein BKA64DRAFT_751856 [Cadophora sp. MPI-SDFR-AT-0126]|nr:hypothetical protein BKA64DRAFT_751856 [Leotiomycetes sp. MPI-SDFR-AT-0126]
MPTNPFPRAGPETRWKEMIRKLQILGNLTVSTHDKIDQVFEEEVQKRVAARNLISMPDVEKPGTCQWEKLWMRIEMIDKAWSATTFDDIVDMFDREVDLRVANGYIPLPIILGESPSLKEHVPLQRESKGDVHHPPPSRVAMRVLSWLQNSNSTPIPALAFSDDVENDIVSWSFKYDGVDATEWGSRMEEALEEEEEYASTPLQSPPPIPRRSSRRASAAKSRLEATTLPMTGSYPRVYQINTSRRKSLTRSTALRDALGLRKSRFTLRTQNEERLEQSDVDSG